MLLSMDSLFQLLDILIDAFDEWYLFYLSYC